MGDEEAEAIVTVDALVSSVNPSPAAKADFDVGSDGNDNADGSSRPVGGTQSSVAVVTAALTMAKHEKVEYLRREARCSTWLPTTISRNIQRWASKRAQGVFVSSP